MLNTKSNRSLQFVGSALCDIHDDFESKFGGWEEADPVTLRSQGGSSHEVLVKFQEGWVAGMKANARELFVVLDNKSKSLVEVDSGRRRRRARVTLAQMTFGRW